MKSYQELKQEFDEKVKRLRETCPHTESEWMPYQWAPGHFAGKVKLCLNCGKTLESRDTEPSQFIYDVAPNVDIPTTTLPIGGIDFRGKCRECHKPIPPNSASPGPIDLCVACYEKLKAEGREG